MNYVFNTSKYKNICFKSFSIKAYKDMMLIFNCTLDRNLLGF